MTLTTLDLALVEEATKKSGLIWVRGAGADRALWHAWVDGAAHVLGDGPGEQPFPGLADGAPAEVTVRSKDKGGRLVAWTATVRELAPRGEEWTAAVAELKGKRLNAPDSEGMTERWARECRLLRLEPRSVHPGLPDGSLAAVPPGSPATTRRPVPAALPRLLLKRKRKPA
ncbi:hypothetical protein [Streptomyces subrutilus]|uniref:Uncharacterized protein n=1 Tax=Streptomyces subrutilus TaxID=36818 RepID=A0A5P2UMS4_9ACTN|nr:hypothetical protein [Streptomyces subrutilus]QEU78931.1 hypothetical protein CP968_12055 [Streptomyces subrutilus]WSJ31886.1 hypothetical protein OG479_22835 [Streptomyces subrutilus]GGZ84102.1 hypothetical protein GCM10010371_49980 [Streptomyces subrutilus]